MNAITESSTSPSTRSESFTSEQKEYLAGVMAGIAERTRHPYVGLTDGGAFTSDETRGGDNLAAAGSESVFGTPLSDLTRQELWKHSEHPLDGWDRILRHAEGNATPDEENTFRFRNFGLFYVAPAQDSFMVRCRIPAGELTAGQFRGLGRIAEEMGNGLAAITTRSNVQIRELPPSSLVNVLTRLQSLGLTARGSGVDNVRNITASPTAGFDPAELIDVRPYAHALHHYILNNRDLYLLPRKFNVAFEGGGSIDNVTDTNDIGFMAVPVGSKPVAGRSVRDGQCVEVPPGVYFRVELAGITGHKQLAIDSGLLIRPAQAVAVAAAMIRVFIEHGDRTDRKKARLKYLIDRWGMDRFVSALQEKLDFALVNVDREACGRRSPAVKHGQIGVHRQKQRGLNYVGVVVPVGVLTSRQMDRLATLAENYGSGELRLTPWQNLVIPGVSDAFVSTVTRNLRRIGLSHESNAISGGLVACTGNKGCKWASTDTKGHALALAKHLESELSLDQPLNIHLTGCPHSCAQHYVGDIGLIGVKVKSGSDSVEGYNVVLGGGTAGEAGIGREVFKGISFEELPTLLERVLRVYLDHREGNEPFTAFTRKHDVGKLQELFSP